MVAAHQRKGRVIDTSALKILIPRYAHHDCPADKAVKVRHDLMRATRKLLVECYEGLGKSDDARYLNEAPLQHIHGHAQYGTENPMTCFPAYSEYMARPWTVYGLTKSDSDGEYHIKVNFLLDCDFFSCSPRFKTVFCNFGMLNNETKRFAPLPGTLVDAELEDPCFTH